MKPFAPRHSTGLPRCTAHGELTLPERRPSSAPGPRGWPESVPKRPGKQLCTAQQQRRRPRGARSAPTLGPAPLGPAPAARESSREESPSLGFPSSSHTSPPSTSAVRSGLLAERTLTPEPGAQTPVPGCRSAGGGPRGQLEGRGRGSELSVGAIVGALPRCTF